MKHYQKGFSAVEAVIIIVIVGLLGFGGWYVWQKKHNADSQKSSQTAQTTGQKAAAKQDAANDESAGKNVIRIKELGVQFTVPDELKDVSYIVEQQVDPNDHVVTYARLTSQTMLDTEASCDADASTLGVIAKGEGAFSAVEGDEALNGYYGGLEKQFDDFFITYSHSQATCSAELSETPKLLATTQLQKDLENMLSVALDSLELSK